MARKGLSTAIVWDFENVKNPNKSMQVDINKQKLLVERGRGTNVTHIAFISNFTKSKNGKSGFHKRLEGLGFVVKTKAPKKSTNEDGSVFTETDMDGEIVTFLLTETTSFSTVVMISGDGDMLYPLQKLKDRGKVIEVYSIKGRLSKALKAFKTEYLTGFQI